MISFLRQKFFFILTYLVPPDLLAPGQRQEPHRPQPVVGSDDDDAAGFHQLLGEERVLGGVAELEVAAWKGNQNSPIVF